jgi:phosphate transport system permease protein
VAAFLLALVPVGLFVGIVVMVVVQAAPVIDKPGLENILGTTLSSRFSLTGARGDYGLLPALWGTIQVTLMAVLLALPVALAMAIVSAEFPMGALGRVLRPLLGVLAGVPPIVYAIAAVVFVTVFIAPKFAGAADFYAFANGTAIGLDPAGWPPPGVPWNEQGSAFPWPPNASGIPNSTLLGGILVALLVIPFMAPLIFEAMRNVPSTAREASVALGATRGYTLRRVIIPHALPGIVAAVMLASLKALGDVIVIALAVGWQAEVIPFPLFDILERTPTLAATGGALLGGVGGSNCHIPAQAAGCNTGYAAGVMLLLFAAVIVVTATVLEGWLRRRLRT